VHQRRFLGRSGARRIVHRRGETAPRAAVRSATRGRGALALARRRSRRPGAGHGAQVAAGASRSLVYAALMQALVLRQLTKTYKNGIKALKGIDLEVAEGDFFALLGPNGAGKTTIIGIVTSLVNKTAGTVEVFGHDMDRELEEAKSCIGVVPQEINFNMFETLFTIVVNQAGFYGIPRPLAKQRAEKYLKQLQLWDRRHSIARSLSGGMKRRLMIARALMHQPKLLILDEPTAGVDIEIRRSMWDFLRNINDQGTTIILTTHYLEEAENLCRNVAIIEGGRIIERDSMPNVLRKLQTEVFVLNLSESRTAPPQLAGFKTNLTDDHTLEIEVSKGQRLNDIFAQLSSQGIGVNSMRNKVNRLEELFIRLVDDSVRSAVKGT
jgi:ABC-2 type transport system ATP-binding protein